MTAATEDAGSGHDSQRATPQRTEKFKLTECFSM